MIGFKGLLAVVLVLGTLSSTCAAQNNRLFQAETTDEVFLMAPRPLLRLLREGEIAFKEQRYADGIAALSALLLANDEEIPEDVRGQDYFVEQDFTSLYHKSLKGEAHRLLSELPPEGRRTLEVQLGVTARRDLNKALAAKDFIAIGDVARQYLHTEAGYDAHLLWAQYKLTSGHPLAAASLLQKLLDYPAARQRFGPPLALATARAWRLAGNPETAGLTMKMAAALFPGASVVIDGQQLPLEAATDWVQVLSRSASADAQPMTQLSANSAWTVSGGAPEGNATSSAGLPLPIERWVREIHSSLPEQQAILRQSEAEAQKGRVLLPKFELRMVGDLVLTKTTDASLLAIDFETGVIKWPIYFHNTPVQLTNLPYAATGGNAALSTELQNRVWGSSAFGKFSCDDQRLYLVSDPADQLLDPESMYRVSQRTGEVNFMEAASIQAEGAILWRVGGVDGSDEPQLADAYFLGPPLPYEGELYCLADFKGETKLVVLDAESGRLRWKQQLVHSAGSPLSTDPGRRSQALSPTISDGVILCPTGLGAVAAVDLLTRSLKWGATYSIQRTQSNMAFRGRAVFGDEPQFSPLERRWQEPAMIAQDGVVLISPPESDDFHCRDILTGQLRLGPQRRNTLRYLAGLRDGRVIAVGERQVSAIELSSGKPVWQTEYPSGLTLAGKGLWQADGLMLPLADRQIIRIDTKDGALTGQLQVSQPLGNLFAYRDQLLSVSSSAVTVYYTRDALTQQVQQRLAADPKDTWALNQQSQLALMRGDWDVALSALEESYAIDPHSADTRYFLANLLLTGLQDDFAKFEGLAQKYAGVVEFGPQRFRFLQQLTLGKIQSGQHLDAFQRLLGLIPKVGSTFASTQNRQRDLELAPGYTVDSDAWIATALARSYEQATEAERVQMNAWLSQELKSIQNMLVPLQLEKLRFFQWLSFAGPNLIELASTMLGGEEQTVAENVLVPMLHSDKPQLAAAARKLLAQPTLSDRYASRFNHLGLEDTPGAPAVTNNQSNAPAEGWHAGMVQVSISDNNRYAYGNPIEIVSERYGRPEISVALSGSMVMLRTANGEDRGRLEFPVGTAESATDEMTRGTIRGGLLLIEKSSELAAFDIQRDLMTGSDAMLWRHSLFSPGAAPTVSFNRPEVSSPNTQLGFALSQRKMPLKQQSIVGPLTPTGVVIQVGTKLKMLSALSGRQVWVRDGFDDSVSLAAQGNEIAVVHRSAGRVQILDCRDGAELRKFDISGNWTPWFTYQNLVVELSKTDLLPPPPTVVRVWNAMTGEDVLRVETSAGSCADVCEGRYLVVLEPNFKLHYCDLGAASQPVIRQHAIQSERIIQSVSVERFEDRLVVLCSSERGTPGLEDALYVSGDVFGLQAQSGDMLWKRPGRLRGMQFPKSQPRQSPFMLVFRTFPERDDTYPASVALIDLRSGRLAYSNPWLGLHAGSGFDMSLHRESQTIQVGLGARRLTFQVTDDPRPPQPIFWFGPTGPEGEFAPRRSRFNESLFGR